MILNKNLFNAIPQRSLATATTGRFPSYLIILKELERQKVEFFSASILSEYLGIEAITVRKDISTTGMVGRPKVGFSVSETISAIEKYLGRDRPVEALIVGVGKLGSALLGDPHFREQNIKFVAGLDLDHTRFTAGHLHGIPIYPVGQLPTIIQQFNVKLGVITTPATVAPEIAGAMMDAGIKGIWNFAPIIFPSRNGVIIQHEDLSAGLAVLSMKVKKAQEREMKGPRTVHICLGSSCFARGGATNLEQLENYLEKNNLAQQVDLNGSRCSGNCTHGPNITIDGQIHHAPSFTHLLELLQIDSEESTELDGV